MPAVLTAHDGAKVFEHVYSLFSIFSSTRLFLVPFSYHMFGDFSLFTTKPTSFFEFHNTAVVSWISFHNFPTITVSYARTSKMFPSSTFNVITFLIMITI